MLVQEDRQPHYRVPVRDLELVTEVARSRKGEGRVRNRRHPQSHTVVVQLASDSLVVGAGREVGLPA